MSYKSDAALDALDAIAAITLPLSLLLAMGEDIAPGEMLAVLQKINRAIKAATTAEAVSTPEASPNE